MLGTLLLVALQTSSTNCIQTSMGINCNTYAPPAYQAPPPMQGVDIPRVMQQAEQLRTQRIQNDAAEAQLYPKGGDDPAAATANSFQTELANRMGILARQGRCEDAFRLAALAGESVLADESRRICPF